MNTKPPNHSDDQSSDQPKGQQPNYQFGQDPTSASGQSDSPYGSLPPVDASAAGAVPPSYDAASASSDAASLSPYGAAASSSTSGSDAASPNPYGTSASSSTPSSDATSQNPYDTATSANPYGAAASPSASSSDATSQNPYDTATSANPYGAAASPSASSSDATSQNPYDTGSYSAASANSSYSSTQYSPSTPDSSSSYGSGYGAQGQPANSQGYYGNSQPNSGGSATDYAGGFQQSPQLGAAGMPPTYGVQQTQQPKERNMVGIIALVLAILGAIIACIPFPFVPLIGWLLLIAGFIMGIVAVCLSNKKKIEGIIAIIVSIIGGFIALIVAIVTTAGILNEAANDVVQEIESGSYAPPNSYDGYGSDNTSPESSRENPLPLGTDVTSEEWTVTVKSVDLDATEKILSENKYTQEPKPGNVFILLDMTITYTGDDPAGSSAFFADIAYVSPSGNTFNEMVYLYDSPDELDRTQTLYNGASVSGKLALEVPKDKVEDGVISIKPGSLADPSFVAMK